MPHYCPGWAVDTPINFREFVGINEHMFGLWCLTPLSTIF